MHNFRLFRSNWISRSTFLGGKKPNSNIVCRLQDSARFDLNVSQPGRQAILRMTHTQTVWHHQLWDQDAPLLRFFKTCQNLFFAFFVFSDWNLRRVSCCWAIGGHDSPRRSVATRRRMQEALNLLTIFPLFRVKDKQPIIPPSGPPIFSSASITHSWCSWCVMMSWWRWLFLILLF